MLHMIKMLTNNIRITLIAPKGEVCEAQCDWVVVLFVVGDHVRLHVATAANDFAFDADPVFFGVVTVFARGFDGNVFEFFDGSDIFSRNAVRTF